MSKYLYRKPTINKESMLSLKLIENTEKNKRHFLKIVK